VSLRFESEDELRRLAPELAERNAARIGLRRRPTGDLEDPLPGVKPPRESEASFQAWFLGRARELGWRTAHFRTARTEDGRHLTPVAGDGAGFPDNVLLRGGRLVVAELKSDKGTFGRGQPEWLAAWREVPCAEVFVWRPKDRPQIEEVLR
jgi:hypothetical protein